MEERRTGLFGKLPAHGDFVHRFLPRSFVAPWDAWVSAGIQAAEAVLGEAWGEAWDAAPVWRFHLTPGACGPGAVVGVVATSRDQVGRRYPLTLAALPPATAVAPPPADWFAALETAALAARAGGLDADALTAVLPPLPDETGVASDGESLFWATPDGTGARAMLTLAGFHLLLEDA